MKLSPTTQTILEIAVTGVAYGLVLSSEYGRYKLFQHLLAGNRMQRIRFKKRITEMEQQGYIRLQDEKIYLTPRGKELLARFQNSQLTIKKDKWDGQWHIVAYDIPNHKKKARDAFRYKLKQWELYKIQESMWVSPYSCKEEIAVVAQEYGIAPYVLYMIARELPLQQKLIRQFGLE